METVSPFDIGTSCMSAAQYTKEMALDGCELLVDEYRKSIIVHGSGDGIAGVVELFSKCFCGFFAPLGYCVLRDGTCECHDGIIAKCGVAGKVVV